MARRSENRRPLFVLGDISTHTFYISQLVMPDMKIASLLCDRQSFIPSRAPLEDNAMVLMHYENGAVGRMWASAINAGAMDSQSIRVVGSRASLQWSDSTPGELRYEIQGSPTNAAPRHALSGRQRPAEERLGALHTEGLAESGPIFTSSSPSPSAPASAAIGKRWPR